MCRTEARNDSLEWTLNFRAAAPWPAVQRALSRCVIYHNPQSHPNDFFDALNYEMSSPETSTEVIARLRKNGKHSPVRVFLNEATGDHTHRLRPAGLTPTIRDAFAEYGHTRRNCAMAAATARNLDSARPETHASLYSTSTIGFKNAKAR